MKRKHYNRRWDDEETFALIEARTAKDAEFKSKNSRHPVVWASIQSSVPVLADRTVCECIKKWKNLADVYKRMKDPKTGTAPTTLNAANWVFFTKMNDLMGSKHSTNPSHVIESTTITETLPLEDIDLDDLIEYDPIGECDLSNLTSLTDLTQPNTSQSAIEAIRDTGDKSKDTPKKRKNELLEYIKERDKKIFQSIDRNNKMIRAVHKKYFPEVELSSDSD